MLTLTVVRGDIVEQRVEAVVNAANRAMRGGGGVDGAIHRAAGPGLLRECVERFPHGLETGDAGWTTGGRLSARWVIHTVGPNHRAGERDRSLLESCYRRSLEVADELGARSVAFPLISAGVYGWPVTEAAETAVEVLATTPTRVEEARLVAFDDAMHLRLRAGVFRRFPPRAEPGTVGELFNDGVHQWGMRGDPPLWRELADRLANTPLPPSADSLRLLVSDTAAEVIGQPLYSGEDTALVPPFDPGHGMSAGVVHLAWWRQTGVPILVDRYERAMRSRGRRFLGG